MPASIDIHDILVSTYVHPIPLRSFFTFKSVSLTWRLVRVKFSQHRTWWNRRGLVAYNHQFSTSALDISCEPHTPDAAAPVKKAPGTHWIGGWVSPRSHFVIFGEQKDLLPLLGYQPILWRGDQLSSEIYVVTHKLILVGEYHFEMGYVNSDSL